VDRPHRLRTRHSRADRPGGGAPGAVGRRGTEAGARRRNVPAAAGGDSLYTYVYVYPLWFELPKPPDGGNAVLRAAGLSRAQSDSFAAALRRLTVSLGGGKMRQAEY
jgi:hypothetical protein